MTLILICKIVIFLSLLPEFIFLIVTIFVLFCWWGHSYKAFCCRFYVHLVWLPDMFISYTVILFIYYRSYFVNWNNLHNRVTIYLFTYVESFPIHSSITIKIMKLFLKEDISALHLLIFLLPSLIWRNLCPICRYLCFYVMF